MDNRHGGFHRAAVTLCAATVLCAGAAAQSPAVRAIEVRALPSTAVTTPVGTPSLLLDLTARSPSATWGGDSLQRPKDVLVAASGNILVAESSFFWLLDNTLHFMHTVGRKGDGPGEFQSITGAAITGDTLFVWDAMLRRLTAMRPDGHLLRVSMLTPPDRWSSPLAARPLVAGADIWLAWASSLTRSDGAPDSAILASQTIGRGASLVRRAITGVSMMAVDGGLGARFPFGTRPLVASNGVDAMATADGVEYLVHIDRPRAGRSIDVRRVVPRYPASPLGTPTSAQLDELGARKDHLLKVIAAQQLGPTRNAIEELWVTAGGALWVRAVDATYRYHPWFLALIPSLNPRGYRWDVYSADGSMRGQVALPSNFKPKSLAKCALYGLATQSDGSFMVERFDLGPACRSVGA